MKTEYHYTISRTDRICIIAFVLTLLSWELVKFLIPGNKKEYTYMPETFKKHRPEKNYEKNYKSWSYDPKKKYAPKKKYPDYRKNYNSQKVPPSQPIPVTAATVDELISMGFTRKVAYNIQKYLASGGIINSGNDLMKIYGMDSTQLHQATPYLIFPDVVFEKNNFSKKTNDGHKREIIDINTASALALDSLPGIGPVLSERIVKFRESLGGYTSVNQLQDCYGITQELLDKIIPYLTISGEPAKIAVNQVDLNDISHPYLSFKMKKVIQAYKDQHGLLADASALKKAYPPDSTWIEKLLPYLSFE